MSAAFEPSPVSVAFVGNPNAGKTSLFNALTGSHQKVGNYPGVTVEQVTGSLNLNGLTVECVDLPGLYSLNAQSEDERVAVRAMQGTQRPALLVFVADASNLERNLFLYSQLTEIGLPIIVALTKVDQLDRAGDHIDLKLLSRRLGAPVVAVNGLKERGIAELKQAIQSALSQPKDPIDLKLGVNAESQDDLATDAANAGLRYDWAQDVRTATVRKINKSKLRTDKIDYFLTHRVFGLLFFAAVMYIVFQSIYSFSRPLTDLIHDGFDVMGGKLGSFLGDGWFKSLIVDGVINGVGAVLVFLPQILILFFFIALLEGTGYLARAAFLMDRLFGWCGLSGRAFIPLLSSFACAIPGIMAARVMPDQRSRLATILVAPLMSCSARLPVYILLISAFVEPKYGATWAGIALFGMHLVGLLVAIPLAWFFNRKLFKGKRLPFLLELPAYQWPKWKDVWIAMYLRGKVFVTTAGTTIVAMSIIIWGLTYFPHNAKSAPDAQLANSYLGKFGRVVEPVFKPAGFDWRLTTGILCAFPARETVVPSLGIVFATEAKEGQTEPLMKTLQEATWPDGRLLFTLPTTIGFMVFFALCCQCMSTLATIKKETNSAKWPLFVFTYMTSLAYIAAVIIQIIGNRL